MEQYIPKSALVEKIERIKSILGNPFCLNDTAKASWVARKDVCEDLLSFINSTEVKEVDLEKELDSMITPELKFHKALPSLFDVAKHFFELGLKAQKGEV